LIAEGCALNTDRQFAHFLYRSRSESSETRTNLTIARGRRGLTSSALENLVGRYNEIERMLTGLIRDLERENRQHRG
jgi:four helix bundle protein